LDYNVIVHLVPLPSILSHSRFKISANHKSNSS